MRYPILAALLLLTGCGAGATPPPAVEIRTVTKTVEVAKPCPVTIPERPAPLPAVMPTDLAKFAASVLAKCERDALMVALAADHPAYGWAENKGYASPDHLAALRSHGPCVLHRRSWRLPGLDDDVVAVLRAAGVGG